MLLGTNYRKMIAMVKREGFYYLEPKVNGDMKVCQTRSCGDQEEEVWLLRQRLGHPNFYVIKGIVPQNVLKPRPFYV